ncbi:glutamate 5-kinase [Enterococcus sp. AZ072]|uniref:glutamate 5-kinase n=1 Tax=unclassified Enterococcus TaxID=2608891 RepID=UPI003D2A47BC
MRKDIQKANVIVIKIGTSALISAEGTINYQVLQQLVFVIAELMKQDKKIILVSSGAVALGRQKLGFIESTLSTGQQKASAAVGQSLLINEYQEAFGECNQEIGQLLLTRDILEFAESRQTFTETINQLLTLGILPIINENDAVSVNEIHQQRQFEDNDEVALNVALLMQADLFIMLSDVEGLYSDNPLYNEEAKLFQHLKEVDTSLMSNSSTQAGLYSRGGIRSKLKTANAALSSGLDMVLANGKKPSIIFDILRGEEVGTLFQR